MPLLAYVFALAFDFSDDVFLGVMLVGCVPGAMASNVLTLSARGNVSYSVSLTASATLLSPLVVPAMLYFAVHLENVDRFELMESAFRLLILQVVGPVVLGHLLSQRFTRLERFMHRCGPAIANLSILWIIAVVVNGNHENLSKVGWPLATALLGVNLLGFAGGYAGGSAMRVTDGMRRALTLEVGMQNAGLGSVLATQLFKDHNVVALPPALYTFGCMLTGAILAQYWSQRSPTESDVVTDSTDGEA